jgi:hypothetical protein
MAFSRVTFTFSFTFNFIYIYIYIYIHTHTERNYALVLRSRELITYRSTGIFSWIFGTSGQHYSTVAYHNCLWQFVLMLLHLLISLPFVTRKWRSGQTMGSFSHNMDVFATTIYVTLKLNNLVLMSPLFYGLWTLVWILAWNIGVRGLVYYFTLTGNAEVRLLPF